MTKQTKQFLADLINSISPSGYEEPVAKVWKAEANKFAAKVWTDTHGNSHAIVNPGGSPRVMFAGHYDEIGFQISYIDDKGFLWIQALGGWDPQIAQGQRVQIMTKKGIVRGVIGKVAIHMQTPEQRKKVSEMKDLWVDIGAKDKKDAEKMVEVGDPLVVAYGFEEIANGLAAGRAFDDRAGAFVVLEAASSSPSSIQRPKSTPWPPCRRRSACAVQPQPPMASIRILASPSTSPSPPTTPTWARR